MRHPKPYRVSWIKDKHKLLVNGQRVVESKIGKYFDKILRDIMPMDCCHILLGRPWQHDKRVMCDGRLNQYTLWMIVIKKTLVPLIEVPNEVNCSIVRVCMINGKQFEKDMKKNRV